jgi:hypothetical protein
MATDREPLVPQASTANQVLPPLHPRYSFEEFKLYYESAEKVTDRRIAGNQLNYSVCVALLIAIAYIWNWSNDHAPYAYAVFTLAALVSVIAALFSYLWAGQIRDFKLLNRAKFDVLNEMAPNVYFHSKDAVAELVSFNPFAKEWDKLSSLRALRDVRPIGIIALSSSTTELFIPRAFSVIFVLLFLLSVVSIVLHIDLFVSSWKTLMKL